MCEPTVQHLKDSSTAEHGAYRRADVSKADPVGNENDLSDPVLTPPYHRIAMSEYFTDVGAEFEYGRNVVSSMRIPHFFSSPSHFSSSFHFFSSSFQYGLQQKPINISKCLTILRNTYGGNSIPRGSMPSGSTSSPSLPPDLDEPACP